jgi:hypothetical protein
VLKHSVVEKLKNTSLEIHFNTVPNVVCVVCIV